MEFTLALEFTFSSQLYDSYLLCQTPLISDFRCLLPENEYFLKSGNRIMTEDTDCVNICLKIILPKNRKNSKSGNSGWHHAAYSKKKVFR